MYLGGKKKIVSDDLFIVQNTGLDCQTDAAEFEGLLYTKLS